MGAAVAGRSEVAVGAEVAGRGEVAVGAEVGGHGEVAAGGLRRWPLPYPTLLLAKVGMGPATRWGAM